MGTFAEAAIIDNRLSFPDQGNKCPFSVSACSQKTEVCRFSFSFAVPFSVCRIPVMWRHGHGDMEMEILKHIYTLFLVLRRAFFYFL